MVDEDGAAKSSSGGGKGMSAEGGVGGCRGGARRTKKLLAGEEGAGGGHTVYLILSRFRGVSVVKLLSASFFADDEDNIFFASMMYSANTLSLPRLFDFFAAPRSTAPPSSHFLRLPPL